MAGACECGNEDLSAFLEGPCCIAIVGWLSCQHILCEERSYILLI